MPEPVKSATVNEPLGTPSPDMRTALPVLQLRPLTIESVTTAPEIASGPLLVTIIV